MHFKTSNSVNRRSTRARPITVNFPVPKRAISKLRALAIGKDPRLVDLGVLAVQISDDESIVLGIELEKSKRKPLSIANNNGNSSSSISNTSGVGVRFDSLTRKFESSSSSGFYHNQYITTPARTETFTSTKKKPLQNTAVKRKAKQSLNAARRGVVQARNKPTNKQLPVTAKASTWEMVYSHIGLHGDKWRNQTNPPHTEPNLASQASGVANVPVAQPMLSKDTKEPRRREAAATSPSHKASTATGMYSEDDSSVSSSPCSHSPMNEEELLNLFVDQKFSATSILRQLAESRNKEDESNTDPEHGEQNELSQSTDCNQETSDITNNDTTVVECGKSEEDSSLNRGEATPTTSSTACSAGSVNHSVSTTSTSNDCASSGATTLKRPGEQDSSISLPWSTLFENTAKRQRRSFVDLEIKKEMVDLSSRVFGQEMQRVMQLASSKKPQESTLPGSGQSKTPNQSVALRNYSQYGYYYTSEDLKALGSKALASKSTKGSSSKIKNESVQQPPSLNTDTPPPLNTSINLNTQDKSTDVNNTDSSLVTSTTDVVTVSPQQPIKDETVTQEVHCNTSTPEDSISPSGSTEVISSMPNTSASSITTETTSSTSTLSTTTITKPPEDLPSDTMLDLRRSGQYYALSYVYPMGTVWYPYVAITPYAVLNVNQKNDSNDKTTQGIASSAQYIDLASSMRYWQQLSLLYKNKLLASTPSVPNMIAGPDSNNILVNAVTPPRIASFSSHLPSSSAVSFSTGFSSMSTSIPGSTSVISRSESAPPMPLSTSINKPTRRASVIVANNDYTTCKQERASTSTPESMASTESIGSDGSKSDLVIDNCNRLIEEHCNRMNEVFADVPQDVSSSMQNESTETAVVPSLSFIPDSSIAYVNIGNTQGSRKSGKLLLYYYYYYFISLTQ